MNLRTIFIDGNSIGSLDEFYSEIEKHLGEGSCPWGENLDSLDEIVRSSFNYTSNKDLDVSRIVWLNAGLCEKNLGEEETIKWLSKKFSYSSDSKYQSDLRERIERVKNKTERTLFDIIVEILCSNSRIRLDLK